MDLPTRFPAPTLGDVSDLFKDMSGHTDASVSLYLAQLPALAFPWRHMEGQKNMVKYTLTHGGLDFFDYSGPD